MLNWLIHLLAVSSNVLASQEENILFQDPALGHGQAEQLNGFIVPHLATAAELCSTNRIPHPDIYGLQTIELITTYVLNFTFPPTMPIIPEPVTAPMSFCNVTVIYTHPGWDDRVTVTVLLPTHGWNGRFQATGGGGFVTGGGPVGDLWMSLGLRDGYAVATTDGGHTSDGFVAAGDATGWALKSPGNVDWHLLVDFASVAIHDMGEIGKAVTEAYYAVPPHHSYFFGCSTGGRQGLMLAQKYPSDFDGIAAIFPAINWDKMIMATYWPQFVMNQLGVYPPPCELGAITQAAIEACDDLDGALDGIISLPGLCTFTASSLIGKPFECDGTPSVVTSAAADVADAAWNGPRNEKGNSQWFGVAKDADLSGIALTTCSDDGTCRPLPFGIPDSWIRNYLMKDAAFDPSTLTHSQWDTLFHISVNEYTSVIGTSDPDLSEFRKHGGKLLSWHGLRDPVIPFNGTVNYYDRVLELDANAHDYFRLFLAPGAEHSFINGPAPGYMMDELVSWVERGEAPETLRASGGEDRYGVRMERDVCMYPRVQTYQSGEHSAASSFNCVGNLKN